MKTKKKLTKKTTLILTVALAVVVAVSGTFAWFIASQDKINHLKTADNLADGVEIFEIFDEPHDWKPNQEITKNVGVINAGNLPVLARLSFSEALAFAGAPVGVADPYLVKLEETCTHVHDALCGGTIGVPCAHDGDGGCTECTYGVNAPIPVLFNSTPFNNTNGWYRLSDLTALSVTPPALAALNGLKLDAAYDDLEVWITCVTTTGSTPRTTYSVVAFAPIDLAGNEYNGMDQKVSFDFSVDATSKIVSLTSVKYMQLGPRSEYNSNWKVDLPDNSEIGYSVAETKAAAIPSSPYGQYIEFIYDALDSTFATAGGKWFFNEDDGWFYYIGKVAPGTISPNLLESLKLDADADSYYANLTLDLTVHMEAIQCTAEAVEAVFFGGTAPVSGDSLLIYNKLIADFCD